MSKVFCKISELEGQKIKQFHIRDGYIKFYTDKTSYLMKQDVIECDCLTNMFKSSVLLTLTSNEGPDPKWIGTKWAKGEWMFYEIETEFGDKIRIKWFNYKNVKNNFNKKVLTRKSV